MRRIDAPGAFSERGHRLVVETGQDAPGFRRGVVGASMTSWHKWSERKPTEADARGNYIEWHDSTTGARFIQPSWYSPYAHATGMYWRTPTPLPEEESGPAVAGSIPDSRTYTGNIAPAAAGSDAVRVLEALIEAVKPTLRGSRSVTFYTLLAALAAVKAQEGKRT